MFDKINKLLILSLVMLSVPTLALANSAKDVDVNISITSEGGVEVEVVDPEEDEDIKDKYPELEIPEADFDYTSTYNLEGVIDHKNGTKLESVGDFGATVFYGFKNYSGEKSDWTVNQKFSEIKKVDGTETLDIKNIEMVQNISVRNAGGESTVNSYTLSGQEVYENKVIYQTNKTDDVEYDWASTIKEINLEKSFVEKGDYKGEMITELVTDPSGD